MPTIDVLLEEIKQYDYRNVADPLARIRVGRLLRSASDYRMERVAAGLDAALKDLRLWRRLGQAYPTDESVPVASFEVLCRIAAPVGWDAGNVRARVAKLTGGDSKHPIKNRDIKDNKDGISRVGTLLAKLEAALKDDPELAKEHSQVIARLVRDNPFLERTARIALETPKPTRSERLEQRDLTQPGSYRAGMSTVTAGDMRRVVTYLRRVLEQTTELQGRGEFAPEKKARMAVGLAEAQALIEAIAAACLQGPVGDQAEQWLNSQW